MSDSSAHAYAERIREAALSSITLLLLSAAPAGAGEPADEAAVRIRVTGVVEAPLHEVRAVLHDLEGFGRWFPRLREWRVLERAAGGARVYGRQTFPWPVKDRDYVVDYRWWDTPDGGFALEATGLADAAPPAPEGVVRLHVLRSLWTLRADGPHTRASYTYEGPSSGRLNDLLGRIGARARSRAVIEGLAAEVARRAAGAGRRSP